LLLSDQLGGDFSLGVVDDEISSRGSAIMPQLSDHVGQGSVLDRWRHQGANTTPMAVCMSYALIMLLSLETGFHPAL
jgi:hypothetical protein